MVNLVCKSFVTLKTQLRKYCIRVNNTCCILFVSVVLDLSIQTGCTVRATFFTFGTSKSSNTESKAKFMG